MATGFMTSQKTSPLPCSAAAPRGQSIAWTCLLLPLLSALLLWLCYFPVAWGWLGWVALVPLLCLVRMEQKPRTLYLCTYLGGFAFFLAALHWMTAADYRMAYAMAALGTYCALYFPVALWMIRYLDRSTPWPLSLSVPIVWTGLEFVRSFLFTGFAWYFLGHTQHSFLAVIQISDLAGVYAVSFLLAGVSGLLVEMLSSDASFRAFFRQAVRVPDFSKSWVPMTLPRQVLVAGGLLAATFTYGVWRLSQDKFLPGPRVAMLQGNLEELPDDPVQSTAKYLEEKYHYYMGLRMGAWNQTPKPDLLIWPETSFPYRWFHLPKDLNKVPADRLDLSWAVRKVIRHVAQEKPLNHLLGLNTLVVGADGTETPYCSALMVTHEGHDSGRYDKIHRLPFSEYVPFGDWFPFLQNFSLVSVRSSIRVGEKMTRFSLQDKYNFGVLICYEDTDPCLGRQYVRQQDDGPPVDFLVNMSNEGWFGGSSEHEQHLAISRFRAIECRRALCRAVNMGVSAVIDGNGRVQKPAARAAFNIKHPGADKVEMGHIWIVEEDWKERVPDLPESTWGAFKKVPGVLTATVPLDDRVSIYAHVGDWLPVACWLIVAAVVVRKRLALRRQAGAL